MKLGSTFIRDGTRYEFLGYSGQQRMRVRIINTKTVVSILTQEALRDEQRRVAEAEKKRLRKIAEAEKVRLRKTAEAERDRLRKAADEEKRRQREAMDVEALTETTPALQMLRDAYRNPNTVNQD